MILALLAATLAVVAGFVCGGRISKFKRPILERNGLLALVVVSQGTGLFAKDPGVYGGWVVLGCLSTLWYALRNRGRPGLSLAILGLLLNAVVIFANMSMPVSEAAAERANVPIGLLTLRDDPIREELTSETILPWLSSAIPLALPFKPAVASIGDVLFAAGGALFLFTGLTGFGRDMPERQLTPQERRELRKARRAARAAQAGEDASSAESTLAILGAAVGDSSDDAHDAEGAPARGRSSRVRNRAAAAPPPPEPPPPILVDREAYGYAGSAVPPPDPAGDPEASRESVSGDAAVESDSVAGDGPVDGDPLFGAAPETHSGRPGGMVADAEADRGSVDDASPDTGRPASPGWHAMVGPPEVGQLHAEPRDVVDSGANVEPQDPDAAARTDDGDDIKGLATPPPPTDGRRTPEQKAARALRKKARQHEKRESLDAADEAAPTDPDALLAEPQTGPGLPSRPGEDRPPEPAAETSEPHLEHEFDLPQPEPGTPAVQPLTLAGPDTAGPETVGSEMAWSGMAEAADVRRVGEPPTGTPAALEPDGGIDAVTSEPDAERGAGSDSEPDAGPQPHSGRVAELELDDEPEPVAKSEPEANSDRDVKSGPEVSSERRAESTTVLEVDDEPAATLRPAAAAGPEVQPKPDAQATAIDPNGASADRQPAKRTWWGRRRDVADRC